MAMGDEDYSGDYTDSGESEYGDDLSRYSQEAQDYIRANSQTRINGKPVDEDGNVKKAGFGKFGRKTDEDGNSKWGLLKKGEQEASKKPNTGGKGGDKKTSLGEKENNVGSDADDQSTAGKFKNAVQGIKDIKSGKIGKGKGKLKKAGPLMAILALCLGFGGSSFFGQMAMPFSLISQFQENFDSIGVSQNTRSKAFLKFQTGMLDDGVKDCVKAHYFKADEFRVSKRQKNKLAKSGITFADEDGITVMKYKRANGEIQTIVADPKHAGNGKISFDEAWSGDPEFHNSYKEGARTWRGSVKDWFDKQTSKLLSRLGIDRNKWKNHDANDPDSKNKVKEQISGDADNDSADAKSRNANVDEVDDVDPDTGEKTGSHHEQNAANPTSDSDATLSKGDTAIDPATGKPKLEGKLKTIASKFESTSNIISAATGAVCGVMDFIGAVYGIVAAYQAVQIVTMASEFFEGIQKGQIDTSQGSPIHDLSNSLTQPLENTYDSKENGKITRTRSAMEAAGISAIYGGTSVDTNDVSVKSFNMNSLLDSIASDTAGSFGGAAASLAANISNSIAAFRACNAARMAAATVSAVSTVVKIVSCFIPPGVGCAIGGAWEAIDRIAGAAISVGFSTLVGVAISHMVPFIAGIFTRKAITAVAGEDLGNMLVSGANMYMGQNHQQSGGSVANKDSLISYLQERDRVIAENAQYERDTRSPFDIRSKYTFLGSLANQMIPIASQMTSITSTIKGTSTVIGNAIRSLTPQSSAASAAIEAQAAADLTEKSCPDIAEIGGVADAFCNPYFITDTSTMDDNPASIVNSVDNYANSLDDNGDIKDDGNLARYIIYCGQRVSPWGKIDQNIAGDVQEVTVGNSLGDNALGVVPIVGDVIDVLNNGEKEARIGYITGKACVTGNDGGDGMGASTATWEENKKYQRYIEDQRLAEAAGIVEESTVSKFISQYYEKHPLDTSFEGVLARYSGYTKDTVVAVLDTVDALAFVNEYEPRSLYPYPMEEEEESKIEIEDNDVIIDYYVAQTNNVVYDDLRYRSFAV